MLSHINWRSFTNFWEGKVNNYVRVPWLPILTLLIAAFLRLYWLPLLPPGLNFDEAGNGVAALDILNGEPHIWWRIGGGKEPLWPYLIALSTAGFGPIPLALRLPAAFTGILTVAAAYPLMLALFRRRTLALFTMLGLALSQWHLHFSRLGFRAILMPLLSTLAIYFFWKAFASMTRRTPYPSHAIRNTQYAVRNPHSLVMSVLPGSWFAALSALFTALAIYAYLAGRLLPLVILLFAGLCWLHKQRTPASRPPTPHPLPLTLYFLLLVLFLLPLIIYFVLHPADFAARAAAVSIFNPEWHQGDLPGAVWTTLTLTLGTFLGLTSDANPLVNLPGQPVLPLYLAPFFLLGLGFSLYQAIRFFLSSSSHSPAPYLLLLCWWLIMLLPALLAPEGAPHHLRLIGALVPTYGFLALGLVLAMRLLRRLIASLIRGPWSVVGDTAKPAPTKRYLLPAICYLLPATCYLFLAAHTFVNYFIAWPLEVDFTLPFDLYATRLAGQIAGAPPEAAYVLPMDIRAGDEARHYTLDYLMAADPTAAYTYLPVDERNAVTGLTQAAAGRSELRVVRWTDDKHQAADAKEIVTFLLKTKAELRDRVAYQVYEVETYALPAAELDFSLPAIDRTIGADFEGQLRLDAAYVPSTVAPGDWLPVALSLAPVAPVEADYKTSLRLVSPSGERVVQKDRVLLHNFHQGTSLWPPETVNEYYLLPVPADAIPGEYTVTVVLYHPDTLTPLVAGGLAELPVGMVRIR